MLVKGQVAGFFRVDQRTVGQKEQIVRHARTHAPARLAAEVRVPPVLHVALAVLTGGAKQYLPPDHRVSFLIRGKGQKRRRVLKLVAEAVGAGALIH